MFAFWLMRKAVKRIWLKLGGQVIEYCKRCGRRQPLIWGVSNPLWREVTGRTEGVFCPECFDHIAGTKGIHLYWTAGKDPSFD